MTDIIIRDMVENDRNTVFEMMKTFYHSDAVYTNGSDEIYMADIDACLSDSPYLEGYTFCENGEIVGYGMLAKSFSTEFGRPCIWIEDIYLVPECRGRGVAPRFFALVDEKYPAAVKRLEAEKENVHAVHVYEKQGFTPLPYLEMKK